MTRAEKLIAEMDNEMFPYGGTPGSTWRALRPLLDALIECGKVTVECCRACPAMTSLPMDDAARKLAPYFRERAEWTARAACLDDHSVMRNGAWHASFRNHTDRDAYLAAKIKEECDG